MGNGRSYQELNVSENSQAKLDASARAGFTTSELAGIYIKEQTEYIQNQIDKIRDSVEDRQSRIA